MEDLLPTPFVRDERYEFDAPKYCDLITVAKEEEGDTQAVAQAQAVDQWFARAEVTSGLSSPKSLLKSSRKTPKAKTGGVSSLVASTVQNENVPNCSSGMEPSTAKKSVQWCGADVECSDGEGMDIDSPMLSDTPEAARPTTRSQTKQKASKSRVLQHLGGASSSSAGTGTSGVKRVLQPIAHLPVRSTKALTEPMDFELQTSKRPRTHQMLTRSTPTKDFVPLVERTRLVFEGGNDRFAQDQAHAPFLDNRPPPALTNPKTPNLRSRSRAASRSSHVSTSLSSLPSTTWEKSLARGAGPAKAPAAQAASARPRNTQPAPFRFATDLRYGGSAQTAPAAIQPEKKNMQAAARPGASKARGVVPHSPKFRTKERAQQRGTAFVFQAQADPAESGSARKQRLERLNKLRVSGTTKPQPFSFQTDMRAASSHHATKSAAPYKFHARPVPVSTTVQHHTKLRTRPLTIPESPALLSKDRHRSYREQHQQQLQREEQERKQATKFKARGILVADPFIPQQGQHLLTIPQPLHLASEHRAIDRSEFDRSLAEKERLAQIEREAELAQQRLRQDQETRQLRKSMVPKARGVPDFSHPFCPSGSDAPLTEPQSPILGVNTRAQRHRHLR